MFSYSNVKQRRRFYTISLLLQSALVVCVLLCSAAQPANAVTCPNNTFYEPGQVSVNGDFKGQFGYLTDPVVSSIPGNDNNNDYHEHILIWGTQYEETIPSGDQNCGLNGGISQCWVQVGVGMGFVGYTGSGQPHAFNGTELYQPYYENFGPDQTYHVSFYPGISIKQGVAIEYEVMYDGHNGSLGLPQFQTYVKDSSGNLRALGTDELYYATDHEFAATEVETSGETSTCPTLTNTSPYQTFGTDGNGNPSSTYALELEDSSGGWAYWSGYPNTQQFVPYYFAKLYGSVSWPETFQTSGPS